MASKRISAKQTATQREATGLVLASAAFDRLGSGSPLSIMSSDPHLLRWFCEEILTERTASLVPLFTVVAKKFRQDPTHVHWYARSKLASQRSREAAIRIETWIFPVAAAMLSDGRSVLISSRSTVFVVDSLRGEASVSQFTPLVRHLRFFAFNSCFFAAISVEDHDTFLLVFSMPPDSKLVSRTPLDFCATSMTFFSETPGTLPPPNASLLAIAGTTQDEAVSILVDICTPGTAAVLSKSGVRRGEDMKTIQLMEGGRGLFLGTENKWSLVNAQALDIEVATINNKGVEIETLVATGETTFSTITSTKASATVHMYDFVQSRAGCLKTIPGVIRAIGTRDVLYYRPKNEPNIEAIDAVTQAPVHRFPISCLPSPGTEVLINCRSWFQ